MMQHPWTVEEWVALFYIRKLFPGAPQRQLARAIWQWSHALSRVPRIYRDSSIFKAYAPKLSERSQFAIAHAIRHNDQEFNC
jgi:hypothetical protein